LVVTCLGRVEVCHKYWGTTDQRLAVEFDEKKIHAIFAKVNRSHLPGAAMGIAIGGKPVYRKGFGLANTESPVVFSPLMRMRIYSTTKHFNTTTQSVWTASREKRINQF
jgi:CubicO group peptidase (beta-lactamase class C family)